MTTVLRTGGYYELKCFKLFFNVKIKGIINPSHKQDCNFQSIRRKNILVGRVLKHRNRSLKEICQGGFSGDLYRGRNLSVFTGLEETW